MKTFSDHTASADTLSPTRARLIAFLVSLAIVALAASAAAGQETTPAPTAGGQNASSAPNRSGFTLLLSLGAGYQSDAALDESAVGIGGLNLGIGGFLNERLGLMFRVSGTTTNYNYDLFDYTQTSGVGGVTLQYWLTDRLNVEGGPGVGFWTADVGDDQGLGLIMAAGYSVFHSTKTSIQLGLEWAPVFTDGNVQNVSLNLGFQLL